MTDSNLPNNSQNGNVNDQRNVESEILSNFSRGVPAHLPHVCHAPPYEGHTLAFNVAKEGKRVIIFALPHLQPKQYARWGSQAILIDDDIDSGAGFHIAAEAMRDHFDLIVFVCDPRRLSDEMIFTESEEMLLDLHLSSVLQSRERVFRLLPEERSDNVVLFNPTGVKFADRSFVQPLN